MSEIKDYKAWLSNVDLEGHEEVYQLYSSITNFEGSGIFYTDKKVKNDGYEYRVKADGNEDVLFLESDEAKHEFLQYLASEYTDSDESNIQKWYELKSEIGKVD
ncbi:hypothetical protein [Dyadobacter sediminis]|uniref:Uncharacterized protein n=1 Tax=Dyadobacter sediminis TaxID=1493691 RepID=A0A5R9KF62_9BACT|nr:hypothetical protein [Dyadobacter sediminis]TLU94681.1 hypothetical protein FEM55_10675 [Dyadobacter sediminis]GGB89069.1 hypothetical protein GCM10011325_15730 [Dyadobacter sediminis]